MKARILKKVCKRLKKLAPKLFLDAWLCDEVMELSWEQGSKVKNHWRVGGACDEWGEGTDDHDLLEWVKMGYYFYGDFPPYPEGHEFEYMPDTGNFKPTTRNLLKLVNEF